VSALAALLALASSASWGTGDFLGGVQSRRMSPLAVMAVSQPVGLALLGVAVAARGTGPPGPDVAWACLAAVFGTIGLAAFYRGMAFGSMSVVAPIAGAAAIVPVAFGLLTGDRTSHVQQVGFAIVIVGVVLTSLERKPDAGRWAAGAGFGVVATAAFGVYFILLHAGAADDFLWPAFLFRVVSTSLVWIAVLSLGTPLGRAPAVLPTLVAVGVFDTGGNTLFAAASTHGAVSLTSVLASLYPVVTVLLARHRLHERIHRLQELGIVLTVAGIVMVSAG
jgi:drug/metabolite transporter (DMT)-like permease